jgi:hypothetical protein
MTTDALNLLFVAIPIAVIGLITCRYYRWKKIIGYIPLLLGLSLIFATTLGPLSNIKGKTGLFRQWRGKNIANAINAR